jgi:hypothetical protein
VPATADTSGRGLPGFLGLDVGGGVQTGALAGLFRARLTATPFAHLGFFAEGGFSSRSSTPVGLVTADSAVQQGALGALWSFRPVDEGGPQLTLDVGLEHVLATQAHSEEGVGVVFGARAEWVQRLTWGLFARASLGVDVRPAPWTVAVLGVSATAYQNVSVIAGLALGFSPSFLWGRSVARDTL